MVLPPSLRLIMKFFYFPTRLPSRSARRGRCFESHSATSVMIAQQAEGGYFGGYAWPGAPHNSGNPLRSSDLMVP